MSCTNQDTTICAAWLHDVLEDCIEDPYSIQGIVRNHNNTFEEFLSSLKDICPPHKINQIRKSVIYLTMSQDKSIPKKERREEGYLNLKTKACPSSVIVKFCDRIDNVTTAHHFSQGGFKWYLTDTLNLIRNLGDIAINTDLGIDKLLLSSFIDAKKRYFEKYGKQFD